MCYFIRMYGLFQSNVSLNCKPVILDMIIQYVLKSVNICDKEYIYIYIYIYILLYSDSDLILGLGL